MSLYLSATACGKDHIHRTETILDSGASRHAIRDRSIIQDYKANNGGNVYLGNGEAIKIQGKVLPNSILEIKPCLRVKAYTYPTLLIFNIGWAKHRERCFFLLSQRTLFYPGQESRSHDCGPETK